MSNLITGFDLYSLQSEEPYRAFSHGDGTSFPVPVRFIHGGNAIVTGSTSGKVQLWDVSSGRPLHSLVASRTFSSI